MKEALSPKARITALVTLLIVAAQLLPANLFFNSDRPLSARKVLFIGNSMTSYYDVPGIIEKISDTPECKGGPIHAVRYLPGGVWLEQHWENKEATRLIEQDQPATVIIQEQSDASLRFPEQRYSATGLFVGFVRTRKATPILYNIDIGWWNEANRDEIDTLGKKLEHELAVSSWHAIPVFRQVHKELPHLALFGQDNHHLSPIGATIVATGLAQLLCDSPIQFPAYFTNEPQIVWDLWFPQSLPLSPEELVTLTNILNRKS